MITRMTAVFALLAAAGCADLPDVDQDVCGNLVLDRDEDCDGFSDMGAGTACGDPDGDNGCFFIWDEEAGVVCPDGWGAGLDGRCRRASGAFTAASGSPWRFPAQDFSVGDFDGDGYADVIGNDVATLTALFGAEEGDLSSDLNLLIPQPRGPLTFTEFDEDDLADAVVPMAGGLFVLRGDETRDPEPVAYAPFSLGDIGDAGVDAVPVESLPGNLKTEVLVMVANQMGFLESTAAFTPMPASFDVTKIAGHVPVANLDNDAEKRGEFALAFAGANRVFLFSSSGTGSVGNGNTLTVVPYAKAQTVDLPPLHTVQFGAMFADVDGEKGPDLLVSVKSATNVSRVAVSLNDGNGNFGAATLAPVFDRGQQSPWPLAAGDLNGDGKADYVFGEVVAIADFGMTAAPGMPGNLVPTSFIVGDPWADAAIGDFNGDDFADVAGVVEGTDGVDFLLGVAGSGFFNPFHVDTDDPPRSLRVGDYDGDFVLDVAFAESGFGLEQDRISVIFGQTSGGPSEPVSMGQLGFVDVIEPMQEVVSADTFDFMTDLFVVSSSFPDRDSKAVALLFGSSSRRMLSPFTLSPPVTLEDPNPLPDTPRAALVGEFSDPPDGIRDIVAVADVGVDVNSSGGDATLTPAHLWRIPGVGSEGGLDADAAGFIELPDTDQFHNGCAVWTSGDVDGDGTDEVVAIDNGLGRDFTCFGFGGSPAGHPDMPISTVIHELPGTLRAVRDVHLVDLDADGDLDLLAVFAGEIRSATTGPPVGSGVAVVWNIDGELDVGTASTIEPGTGVFDADAILIDDTGIPALVLLINREIDVARLDPETKQYGALELLHLQKGDGRLEVGDFDADGVDDIAYTVGDELELLMGLPAEPRGAQDTVTGGGQ